MNIRSAGCGCVYFFFVYLEMKGKNAMNSIISAERQFECMLLLPPIDFNCLRKPRHNCYLLLWISNYFIFRYILVASPVVVGAMCVLRFSVLTSNDEIAFFWVAWMRGCRGKIPNMKLFFILTACASLSLGKTHFSQKKNVAEAEWLFHRTNDEVVQLDSARNAIQFSFSNSYFRFPFRDEKLSCLAGVHKRQRARAGARMWSVRKTKIYSKRWI